MGVLNYNTSLKCLNRLVNDYENVAQEYKKGYPLGDQIYPLYDQLKIIKECSKKRNPKNADYLSLLYLSQPLRHTLFTGTDFKTIKTNKPAHISCYFKYKGIGETLAYKASAILVYDNEVLTDLGVDCDDMNKYILETLGEITNYKLEELDMGFSTDHLADIDYEFDVSYEKHRDDFEKEVCQIQNPLCYIRNTEHGIVSYSWKQICELYAHITLTQDNKAIEFCSIWRSDPNKRRYAKMDMYPPPLKCPEGVFNMWSGFDIKGDAKYGECQTFLDHLELVKEGNDYLINWFAHLVQFPGKKTLICPIIRGKPGSGKSVIVDVIIKMLGSELANSTGKMSDIFEKHSQLRKGRIFSNIDEVDAKSGYMHNETLKNAITADTFNYEPKGINSATLTNFNNFLITTNNEKSVVYQQGERRYAVFDMNDKMVGNHEYFDTLIVWSEKQDNIKSLFEYLSKVDLEEVNLKLVPQTEALKETKILSLDKTIKYFDYKITQSFHESWIKPIKNTDMYNDFLHFSGCKKEEFNISKFGTSMKKHIDLCPGIKKTRTNQGMMWEINREECFDWLTKKQYTFETKLSPIVETKYSSDW